MVEIITLPNPILRKKSKPVKKVSAKIMALIKELKKTLKEAKEPKGVGLSAVQIGKPIRIFLARQDSDSEPTVFLNPEITWKSRKLTDGIPPMTNDQRPTTNDQNRPEGCLSVPGYYGLVKRHQSIKLKWTTESGRQKTEKFKGFLATVIQHELDHLNGILFIDRVLQQGGKLYKIEEEKLVETRL